ncbi:flavin-containing monooxygenase [Aspergillus lucknowensis]|uniref:Sterigmatocystin biosynthesis monooxygenase stcW n=1 Tax=Aspergillus lucknowensis TaxID=176173 RepID=A0ABR4LD33_9EURO
MGSINGVDATETPTTRPGNLFAERFSENFHKNSNTGYHVPTTVLGASENRKLKVITVGGGISGVTLAYYLERELRNVEHFNNRYPNCACDVPSASYQLNFALNPDWSQINSDAKAIHDYLLDVVEKLDLRKYFHFNSEVIAATFDEHKGIWDVKIRQRDANGVVHEIEDDCDLLIGAYGILSRWDFPDIPGVDTFKGSMIHTAGWPDDYQTEQWKGQRVAVIGSGASSIQTVPGMQPYVDHMDIFVRTPVWFVSPTLDGSEVPAVYAYTEEQKRKFRSDQDALLAHCKSAENNGMKQLLARMRRLIKDDRLLAGFTPSFSVGCRRITPGDPYIEAIQKPNVDVHFTGVAKITEDGIIGDDGILRQCDTIICATGFDVSYRPSFPLIGLNRIDLRDKWATVPEGYFGLACPDIPNYIVFGGPTFPVQNGSLMGPLSSVTRYVIKIIEKMQRENIKYWVPKQTATDEFNDHAQTWMNGSVWEDNCNAWYKNKKTGRVDSVWPGSALHYMEAIKEPRFEDFEIQYHSHKNRYAYLGLGFVPADVDPSPLADRNPHLSKEFLDQRYYDSFQA